MAIWPWYGALVAGVIYDDAATFLSVDDYAHLKRWGAQVGERPAVKRGRIVNRTSGDHALRERHAASDIDEALAATATTAEVAPGVAN